MFRKNKKLSPSAEERMAEFLSNQTSKPSEEKSELSIKFEALWQLLQKKFGLTPEELEEQISLIKNTTKKASQAKDKQNEKKCPTCERQVSKKTGICLYCGK